MKYVELFWTKGFESKAILEAVTAQASNGASYQEALKRLRVLEALEKIKEGDEWLELEDADHVTLGQAIDGFKFGAVTRDIMKAVKAAKEPKDAKPAEPDSVSDGCVSDRRVSDNAVRARSSDIERVDPGLRPNGQLDAGPAPGEYVER